MTDFVAINAKTTPTKIAVAFEDKQISWQELWLMVENASYYFADKLTDQHQQVVGMLMTNSIEFIAIYLAILHSGNIAAPIDPIYKKLEIDAIVEQLQPAIVLIQDRYADQIPKSKSPEIVYATGLLGKSYRPATGRRLAANKQVASLTFTSGTSGRPKLVPNTHTNHVWNIVACSKVWDWTKADSLLINLPLSHMHGLVMGLSGIIYHGNTLYLQQQSFRAELILEQLSFGNISIFTHTPLAYEMLLNQPGDYDLSKVRLFISGGAPLPPKLWHDFKKRFGVEIVETYGSTETGRIAGNGLTKKMVGSVGKILPGVDMKLGAHNQVMIKSGGVFPGYWHNQAATDLATTSGGYWLTGDVGELKNGYLYLKGRVSETIRRFGYTVSPRDVEWALLEYSKISDAYVMGKPISGQPNDQIYYFLSGQVTVEEVMKYCKHNLPFNWRPDKIIWLKSLPRTPTGKLQIAKLLKLEQDTAHV